ncbi:Rha family transcriptional regulator [[Clostridium] innocuum]|jgi:Rha family phage regulatory protein|nr:Rha family transcriptional regulator [[Clostridium] innocuum]QSI25266.1 toxin Bro [Erysipelotrichaceae bacterium 66202529]DAQ27827.1 MAG TPA: regulatory protein [Caudoviricetes sp.]
MAEELQILHIDGKNVIDSRLVAERIKMQHKDLLKKIRNYEAVLLGAKLRSVDFFIQSNYVDSTGRTLMCYLLTKEGCEMVGNKLTGEKGVLFTAEYVTAFNRMENEIAGLSDSDFRDIPLEAFASYQRIQRTVMKDLGKSPKEIATEFKKVSIQFGINLSDNFDQLAFEQESLF